MKRIKCIVLFFFLVMCLLFTYVGCGGSSSDPSINSRDELHWDQENWDQTNWN